MEELIRKQDAIDALPKLMVPYGDGSYPGDDEKAAYDEALVDAIHELENLPPVQPEQEIIHCKDCKYWKEKPLYTYCGKMYRMGILDVLDYATEENDFCSMAERRGETE